jgi:hypothetical protein
MIALDPGSKGGCVYPTSNGVVALAPKTDGEWIVALKDAMNTPGGAVAYLEDVVMFANKRMPSSSGIKYGASWGFLKGAAMALGYRVVLVPPKKWQKALGLGSAVGMNKTVWKNKLKQRAEQLYPNVKVTLSISDALLIYEAAIKGLI